MVGAIFRGKDGLAIYDMHGYEVDKATVRLLVQVKHGRTLIIWHVYMQTEIMVLLWKSRQANFLLFDFSNSNLRRSISDNVLKVEQYEIIFSVRQDGGRCTRR